MAFKGVSQSASLRRLKQVFGGTPSWALHFETGVLSQSFILDENPILIFDLCESSGL